MNLVRGLIVFIVVFLVGSQCKGATYGRDAVEPQKSETGEYQYLSAEQNSSIGYISNYPRLKNLYFLGAFGRKSDNMDPPRCPSGQQAKFFRLYIRIFPNIPN